MGDEHLEVLIVAGDKPWIQLRGWGRGFWDLWTGGTGSVAISSTALSGTALPTRSVGDIDSLRVGWFACFRLSNFSVTSHGHYVRCTNHRRA